MYFLLCITPVFMFTAVPCLQCSTACKSSVVGVLTQRRGIGMSLMSIGATLLIMLTAARLKAVKAIDECLQAGDVESKISCDFSETKDTCEWSRINNTDIVINWRRDGSDILEAEMKPGDAVNSRARLRSPLICSTYDNPYSLQLKYKIHGSVVNTCELSVFIATVSETNFTTLWSDRSERNIFDTVRLSVATQNKCFKLFLQAKKVQNGEYCQIQLDNIVVNATAQNGSVSQTAICETVSSADTAAGSSSVSSGAIAGIVISLLVIVAIIVVVVFLLRKRSATGGISLPKFLRQFWRSGQSSSRPSGTAEAAGNVTHGDKGSSTRTVGYPVLTDSTNSFCVPNDAPLSDGTRSELRPQANTTGYDQIADTPISSNRYSMLVDGKGLAQDYKQEYQTKTNNLCHEFEALEEPDGGYSTPEDLDSQKSTVAVKTTGKGNMKLASSGEYNKLCLQNPRSVPDDQAAADTYSHIQDQESEYKVPRTDADDYCLAKQLESDGSYNQRSSATPEKPRQGAGDYNHLNLKGARSANAVPSDSSGQSDGEYSHLND